jgi:hypothetical protein
MTAMCASIRARDHSRVLTARRNFLVATPCDGIDVLGIPRQAPTPIYQHSPILLCR